MMGWLFGGLVKQFESAAKEVVRDSSKEIGNLFDDKVYPLADKLDYIAQESINHAIEKTEELESKIKVDIEYLLSTTDEKVKYYLDKIDNIREKALTDTVSQSNFYLENRINQMSLAVMQAISLSQNSIEQSLERIEYLENKLFQDANQIVDKISELIDGKLELIRNELKKYLVHGLPSPLDKCRQRLKIAWKPGGLLSDIELYELSECYELSKLDENTSIDEVLKIYGQLQQNAAMMAALVRNSPELKNRAIKDWIKYGLLCKFWHSIMNNYDLKNNVIPENKFSQILLIDKQ
ncbi:hypothetical protein HUN01_13090 [Nostoc edaphicum CCNP1411]|uniref:Uncharacterized protein n=1 Tax=Nostoc edaphicum CCNP1411 TaxID=1472755 RepID=A0A7D7QM85_9NOSO|nr:hypothetical protein [Nostoc edaphicum]QMS88485.1 hypothetical protein HUN01_13090 [Nostoc edaphicum CCNP1411]